MPSLFAAQFVSLHIDPERAAVHLLGDNAFSTASLLSQLDAAIAQGPGGLVEERIAKWDTLDMALLRGQPHSSGRCAYGFVQFLRCEALTPAPPRAMPHGPQRDALAADGLLTGEGVPIAAVCAGRLMPPCAKAQPRHHERAAQKRLPAVVACVDRTLHARVTADGTLHLAGTPLALRAVQHALLHACGAPPAECFLAPLPMPWARPRAAAGELTVLRLGLALFPQTHDAARGLQHGPTHQVCWLVPGVVTRVYIRAACDDRTVELRLENWRGLHLLHQLLARVTG